MDPNNMETLISRTLEHLKKEYVVAGKTRVRSWNAWLVIGLALGIALGIILVANRSGEFEASQAAVAAPIISYSFDSISGTTVSDSSGNNYTGTPVNTSFTASGKIGQALSFNGINSYLDLDPSLNRGIGKSIQDHGTFSAYVKFDTIQRSYLFYVGDPNIWQNSISFAYNDNEFKGLYLAFNRSIPNYDSTFGFIYNWVPQTGRYYQITVTWDTASNTSHLFVDGQDVADGIAPQLPAIGNYALLGYTPGGSSRTDPYSWQFGGAMDEVKIYSRAITSEDVKNIYLSSAAWPSIGKISAAKFIAVGGAGIYNGPNDFPRISANTTDYIKQNISSMEQMPFDGMTIGLRLDLSQTVASYNYTILGTPDYSYSTFKPDIDNLNSTAFNKFTDNFIGTFIGLSNTQDWFDDTGWQMALNHAKILAQVAYAVKDRARVKGIFIDPEEYGDQLWSYASTSLRASKTLSQYQSQAYLRGKQVIQAMQSQYPGITVNIMFCFGGAGVSDRYDLLSSFCAGMVDGAASGTTINDLNEDAYWFPGDDSYYIALKEQGIFNASNDINFPDKFINNFGIGFGKMLDYGSGCPVGTGGSKYCWENNAKSGNFSTNYYSPSSWQQSLITAKTHTDKYVWLYGEDFNWWTKTNLPQAYIDAITNAKNTNVTSGF